MLASPWTYLVVGLTAAVATAVLTPVVRAVALLLGVVDHPSARKVHVEPTPLLGGLAVAAGIAGSVAVFVLAQLVVHDDKVALRGIALGGAIIAIVGIVDDWRGVRPLWKFAGQFVAAAALIWFEVRVSVFIRDNVLQTLLTVVWIVGITNAFNLLDNMDGLAAGVAAICAAAFYFVALDQGSSLVALLSVATAGASLGFLLHNFHPARIFLGDTGSLLLGFLVASVSVQGIYLGHSKLTHLPVVTPILILGLPLFDTFSVMAIRLARGLPIFQADRNHVSHRLVALGMTQRQAVALIYLMAVATALPATMLSRLALYEALVLLLQEAILFLIIVLLMRAGAVKAEEAERLKRDTVGGRAT